VKRATTVPEAPLRTTDDTTRDVVTGGGVIEKVNETAEEWIRSDGVDVVTNSDEVAHQQIGCAVRGRISS